MGFNSGFKGLSNLYSHWQKCTVAQRDHFEGNVAWMIALFWISQK